VPQGVPDYFLLKIWIFQIIVVFLQANMKKEIVKWFLDIAKYIATAVLLTQQKERE